jgi:hypothetical protein
MSSRQVTGLTLSRISELPSCDVSLRELVAIVTAEDVQPSSVIRGVRHYSLVDVERAVRRYQKAPASGA